MTVEPKSKLDQTYDALSWFGQQLGRGAGALMNTTCAVASSVKYFFEFGVHDIDPKLLEEWQDSADRAAARRLQGAPEYTPQFHPRIGQPYPGWQPPRRSHLEAIKEE